MAENRTAKLEFDGKTLELPILSPSLGPDVIDISKLYAQGGVFTHDPGFTSTSACESTITFIDGNKGELLHRGYPIDQLAEKSHFLEVCYLLLYGELPSVTELEDFELRTDDVIEQAFVETLSFCAVSVSFLCLPLVRSLCLL